MRLLDFHSRLREPLLNTETVTETKGHTVKTFANYGELC